MSLSFPGFRKFSRTPKNQDSLETISELYLIGKLDTPIQSPLRAFSLQCN